MSGFLSDYLEARGVAGAKFRVCKYLAMGRLAAQLSCLLSPVFILSSVSFGMSFLMHESAPMITAMQLIVPPSLRGTAAGLEIVLNSALSALVDIGIGAADDAHRNIRVELAVGLLVTLGSSVIGYDLTLRLWRKDGADRGQGGGRGGLSMRGIQSTTELH